MTQEIVAIVMEEARLSLDELAVSCTVSREWIVEHVRAGALPGQASDDPGQWHFSGRDLMRTRRLHELERTFDANPELAGLVTDLFDELERLRSRIRAAGLSLD